MTTEVKCKKDHSSTPLLSQDVIFNSTKAASLTGHKDNEAAAM